jgi:D-Tyr-tRNAtyr deacylase
MSLQKFLGVSRDKLARMNANEQLETFSENLTKKNITIDSPDKFNLTLPIAAGILIASASTLYLQTKGNR